MSKNQGTNIGRIIAKIDNDFNPDNSDWIPRVAAWVYDAMSMLDLLEDETKRIPIRINDRFGIADCDLGCDDFKLYDKNGCEIVKAEDSKSCGCGASSPSTGSSQCAEIDRIVTPHTVVHTDDNITHPVSQAVYQQTKYPPRYNVVEGNIGNPNNNTEHNYVRIGRNRLELNFDTDVVYAEVKSLKTETYNGCEFPVIPANGLLIEAIGYYCMYKMLTRGYRHPVMNLQASQYGTNPFWLWTQLKDQAKRSVTNGNTNEDINDSDLWQSAFYINTFGGSKSTQKPASGASSSRKCNCV